MARDCYPIPAGAALPEGGAELVGNKAWNLMRMAAEELPVPPGFALPTSLCRALRAGTAGTAEVKAALSAGIRALETVSGHSLGAPRRPLLVSVRSGAAVSMPGMLETVLNVGLNPVTVDGVIRETGNPRLAWDSYRRLVQGYAEVVAQLPVAPFDRLVRDALARSEVRHEGALDYRALRDLTHAMLAQYEALAGQAFPQDPREQLLQVALAVFHSWDAPKAVKYRRLNKLDGDAGTAVTVQIMVFGNAGAESGAGVAFTRNPATGEPGLYADFQFNGQGEDVVAGRQNIPDVLRLKARIPRIWSQLEQLAGTLEKVFKDAQDFEFTLQAGELFLLQTRNAKRTGWAALRIAVDMVGEGLITQAQALDHLKGIDLSQLTRTRFAGSPAAPLAYAEVASLGVASGVIVFEPAAVATWARKGTPVILVRRETTTADLEGIAEAAGLLTAAGVRTSHAAVVARQLGKVSLVGCGDLSIDADGRHCRIGAHEFSEGDELSLDGNTGAIYAGRLPIVTERPERELATLASWRNTVPAVA